jgi:hypothetical protein
LHIIINETKTNTMKTLTTIETLRLQRQGALIEMQSSSKDLRKISEFKFWCKELRKIDEQIKSIKLN